MPHDKNGKILGVGNNVFGKTTFGPEQVAGKVCKVIPGSETCNCIVAFVDHLSDNEGYSDAKQVDGGEGFLVIRQAYATAAELQILDADEEKPSNDDTKAKENTAGDQTGPEANTAAPGSNDTGSGNASAPVGDQT